MNEELAPDIRHIDALLRRSAASFAYPQTPAIAAAVLARVRGREAPRPFAGGFGALARGASLRPALAALAVVVAVVGALLAVPQSRTAIADLFGIGGVRVDRTPATGPTPPVLSPQSFAEPVTFGEAKAVLGFRPRLYARDGEAVDAVAVYLAERTSSAPYVILVYPEFDLYQRSAGFFGKGGYDPSLLRDIDFDGRPALWIDAGGHIAESYDAQGRLLVESRRSVDRATLLWEEDGITFRLETGLSQDEALDVARSLR